MFRSLRSRLAVLATTTTLMVSLLLCVALYLGVRLSLYREVDAFLAGEIMEFRTILSHAGGDLAEVQGPIRSELGSRKRGDLTFRLLDGQGRVLVSSDTSGAFPELWPLPIHRAAGAELIFLTERLPSSGPWIRTCSQWFVAEDGTTRIAQATYLLDQVNASLDRFLRICAAGLALASVMSAIGGRILATRGLRPVKRMAAAARRISVENLSERLVRSAAGDELDHLAETFNDMLMRLEKQVARIKQFTADAAHELRTPLAALRGNAEVALSADRSAEELRTVLADSIEEYDRLAHLADDLLLLARADAGQRILGLEPVRFDVSVADVIDLFHPLAEERGVDLALAERVEAWVNGDDGRLRQVLGNLLDNAIKFTPAGGRVYVSLTVTDGSAQLSVRDTGVGIPPDQVERVFDRFYRVGRARSRDDGGAGLGLSICRTIVEAHRGSIRLVSGRDGGTTAIVSLPIGAPTAHS